MTLRQRELTVGNRRVASLEALKDLPTRGIADVYDGQFVIVDSVDYAEMAGSKNYVQLQDQAVEWSAPSDGYVYLDGISQALEAAPNKNTHSMRGDEGNSVAFWFKLEEEADCTLFHVPTLISTNQVNNQSPYGIKGFSINVGRPTDIHPDGFDIPGNTANHFNVYVTLDYQFHYLNDAGVELSASGQLSRQTGYAVDVGEWHHVAVTINNTSRMMHIYLDGAQILQQDLIYNPEVTQALAALSIQSSSVTTINLRDYLYTVHHTIVAGGHMTGSGSYGGLLKGSIDEIFYFNRVLSLSEVLNNFYNQGTHALGRIDLTDCLHHWDLGDTLPIPTETDTLRFENLQNEYYIESAVGTKVWREETFETQVVVRPLGPTPADGYAETKTFVTLDPSYKGIMFSPASDGGFSVLTSNSTTSAWSSYDLWSSGTIALPFFVDVSVLNEHVSPTDKYCLLNVGYDSAANADKNGLRIFLARSPEGLFSLSAEIYDTDGGHWQVHAIEKVEDLSWNMCVLSFDFADETNAERVSLYLNGSVADVNYGSHAESRYVKINTGTPTFKRISVGALPYEDSGSINYRDPFYGKVDQVIISSVGNPSAHGVNNLISEDAVFIEESAQISRWKFVSEDSLGISGVYGPSNNIRNNVYPGTPENISGPNSFGLDLFGLGVATSDLTTLSFSEGHTGTSLPIPRVVPTNWGTYFFDKERLDFSEEYSNEPDYGFIVIRPNDRSADQAGRWVSVISYSVWTAYLFGSSEADLSLEEGQLSNVEEGDLAVFNRNGKIVPIEPIEQWLSPTYFANARPLPDSSGFKGQRCYDGTYMYECVATNTWVRYQVTSNWG